MRPCQNWRAGKSTDGPHSCFGATSWLKSSVALPSGCSRKGHEGRRKDSPRFQDWYLLPRLFLSLRPLLFSPAPLDCFRNAPSSLRREATLLCRFFSGAGHRFGPAVRRGKQFARFLQLLDFMIDLGKNFSYSHGYPPVDCFRYWWSNHELPDSRARASHYPSDHNTQRTYG